MRARLRLLPRRRETLDAAVYLYVNGLPHPGTVSRSVALVSDLGRGVGWMGLAGWVALRAGRRGRGAALAGTLSMLTAAVLVQGPIKHTIRRQRPYHHRLSIVVGKRPTDSSFPSGHTAGSFAAATAFGAFLPRHRPALLGVACAVGVSRIYLGHHFPSDVLVGATLGSLIGHVTGRLLLAALSAEAASPASAAAQPLLGGG